MLGLAGHVAAQADGNARPSAVLRHLGQIFEVCHFSGPERQEFTRLYARAHPKKMLAETPARGAVAVELPDLGDEMRNKKLQGLVSAFVQDIARLIHDEREKGKRR